MAKFMYLERTGFTQLLNLDHVSEIRIQPDRVLLIQLDIDTASILTLDEAAPLLRYLERNAENW